MKRLLISAAAAAALVTGLVLGLHSMRNLDPILEANVEALTSGETSKEGFNTVLKIESSHTLICKGSGNLECTW